MNACMFVCLHSQEEEEGEMSHSLGSLLSSVRIIATHLHSIYNQFFLYEGVQQPDEWSERKQEQVGQPSKQY